MTLAFFAALSIWGVMLIYALTGGADFGGGVWDLFAVGPRAKAQRALIAEALGPIWEANHVWLIIALVLLFMCFAPAFALISTALNIPLTVMLFGIVMRGVAFVVRSYETSNPKIQLGWMYGFSVASLVTPVLLGITIGAIASGAVRTVNAGSTLTAFITPWFKVFPLSVGLFTLCLFAYLAAVYLTVETEDESLQNDFRSRALIAGLFVGMTAFLCLLLSKDGAPVIYKGLSGGTWSLSFQLVTGLTSLSALIALYARRYRLAQILVILQTTFIFVGWAMSQYPWIVVSEWTIENGAASASVLRPMVGVVILGILLVVPSFVVLFNVFKRRQAPMRKL